MDNTWPNRLEIFMLLTLKQADRSALTKRAEHADGFLTGFTKSLSAKDSEALDDLLAGYQQKSDEEKLIWRVKVEESIGKDIPVLGDNVHFSHIDLALKAELPATRKIIEAVLPASYKENESNAQDETDPTNKDEAKNCSPWIERNLRRAFVDQFVALDDIETPGGFDQLSGVQIARLARLAGIREVALACMRIDEVESVSAFMRRFEAEDARAIATQLSTSPQISDERASFAENLVQSTMEMESEPSEMLDLLGIWLIGILLCEASEKRVAYTAQRFPVVFAPRLTEIIEAQSRQTPIQLQKEIGFEIESLVETILSAKAKAV